MSTQATHLQFPIHTILVGTGQSPLLLQVPSGHSWLPIFETDFLCEAFVRRSGLTDQTSGLVLDGPAETLAYLDCLPPTCEQVALNIETMRTRDVDLIPIAQFREAVQRLVP